MKKRILAVILAATLSLTFIPTAFAAETERGVARFEELIAPQYEDAGIFSNDLAPVKKDGKWGYIDLKNKTVVPFEYDYACFFYEGYAIVGKFDTRPYEHWDYEKDAYVTVHSKVIVIGRIDTSGNYKPLRGYNYDWETGSLTKQDLYYDADWFSFTRQFYYYGGWVNINNRVFDTNGDQFETIDIERYAARFAPTEALVAAWDLYDFMDGAVYLDLKGNVVLNLTGQRYFDANNKQISGNDIDWDQIRYRTYISGIRPFNQGLAAVWEATFDHSTYESTEKFGFINKSGKWVIPPQFDSFYVNDIYGRYQIFADNGLASVSKEGRYGAIDINGRTVVPFKYDVLWPFSEGLAAFELGGRYGYVDATGKELIPAKFVAATGFSNGFAIAGDGTKGILIDRKGNPIPGADKVNLNAYYSVNEDGSVITRQPGKYITTVVNGKYGFGKLSYDPPLPEKSEMNEWAYDEVVAAIEANLVPASLQNQYRSNITRNDYSRLVLHAICTMLDTELEDLVQKRTNRKLSDWVKEYKFTDVSSETVAAAYALGLVTGYEDGTFRPNNRITRQEAAVLLWRAAGVLGMNNANPPASEFADRGNVASWARREVDYVNSIGVMNGLTATTFSPTTNYTRQQSYMTIIRLLNALLKEKA